MSSALITREPKLDLNITKRGLLRLKVRFGLLSVTLSNVGETKKPVVNLCALWNSMQIDI
jgi:hypothetical protein